MILKLIAMIILGLLSAALSLSKKNYYVNIFDDIMARDPDENASVRVGRGFVYGFLFPVYLSLIIMGVVALLIFLVVAGIIAAIVFALVWLSEKLIPHERLGDMLRGPLETIGIKSPRPYEPASPQSAPSGASAPTPPPAPPAGAPKPAEDGAKPEEAKGAAPDAGINVTRRHSLD